GDDFSYVDRFQDSSWLSLMNDRVSISKYFLKSSGSILVHLDHNAEHLGRILLDINFKNGFINNIAWSYRTGGASKKTSLPYKHDSILFFAKDIETFTYKPIYERQYLEKYFMGAKQDENGRYYTDTLLRDVIEGVIKDVSNNKVFNTRPVLNLSNEFYGFKTQKPEGLLYLLQCITSQSENEIFLDFFAGSGTSLAVAQKLNKKWIGIEMGEHIDDFYIDEIELNNTEKNKNDLYKKFVVLNYKEDGSKIKTLVKKVGILGRLKQVLSTKGRNEPCGITNDINWQGGGFFKYYELEQYEEVLANCKYEDGDLFNSPLIKGWQSEGLTGYWSIRTPYQEYVFMKDEKMLKALEIDYENNKVKVDLTKLYPNTPSLRDTPLKEGNIDIAETLSNLTGKWIKKITPLPPLQEGNYEVEFEDGTKIDTKDLDYKLIKPLIWWE
ncbi:MAG TPA: site-specific DNA-methyltransferase, partial [bacterium]|nr:site-specific DNA-methyltransferase [bacterium]